MFLDWDWCELGLFSLISVVKIAFLWGCQLAEVVKSLVLVKDPSLIRPSSWFFWGLPSLFILRKKIALCVCGGSSPFLLYVVYMLFFLFFFLFFYRIDLLLSYILLSKFHFLYCLMSFDLFSLAYPGCVQRSGIVFIYIYVIFWSWGFVTHGSSWFYFFFSFGNACMSSRLRMVVVCWL